MRIVAGPALSATERRTPLIAAPGELPLAALRICGA